MVSSVKFLLFVAAKATHPFESIIDSFFFLNFFPFSVTLFGNYCFLLLCLYCFIIFLPPNGGGLGSDVGLLCCGLTVLPSHPLFINSSSFFFFSFGGFNRFIYTQVIFTINNHSVKNDMPPISYLIKKGQIIKKK